MKRIIVSLTVCSIAALSLAGGLKDMVMATNNAVIKAIKAKDVAAFEKAVKPTVTKDFKYIEMGRTMDYKTMVSNMKMGFQMMDKVEKAEVKLISCKESGNKGTAVYVVDMVNTMMGEDKKVHKIGFKGKSTDMYVKVNGKWMCKQMTWTEVVMTMDGKPFDPSKMAPPANTGKGK
ncbi:MAG: nuclear transport factor 2 family protein [Chthonomonas sp.]|nr:nuclear transport factor 2 family protein [Chthonomonas sp.]